MGRLRRYNDGTRAALLAAAERLVEVGGLDALSLRAVSRAAGTSTQAVYSLFGSKDELVSALATQAFDLLADKVERVALTDDPAADLVEVGVKAFRDFVTHHPSLYRIAFQRVVTGLVAAAELTRARERALSMLLQRVERVAAAGLLGAKSTRKAAVEFHSMCEGLANVELRGETLRLLSPGQEELAWREALSTVVLGFLASKGK